MNRINDQDGINIMSIANHECSPMIIAKNKLTTYLWLSCVTKTTTCCATLNNDMALITHHSSDISLFALDKKHQPGMQKRHNSDPSSSGQQQRCFWQSSCWLFDVTGCCMMVNICFKKQKPVLPSFQALTQSSHSCALVSPRQ